MWDNRSLLHYAIHDHGAVPTEARDCTYVEADLDALRRRFTEPPARR